MRTKITAIADAKRLLLIAGADPNHCQAMVKYCMASNEGRHMADIICHDLDPKYGTPASLEDAFHKGYPFHPQHLN